MTAPVRFLLVISVLVAAAAVLLAPRGNERLAVLRDEDAQSQIIALLQPRLDRGESDPAILAALGRAYARTGNDQRAVELLERYIALRPEDGDAYGLLADIYGKQHNVTDQIAMLRRSIAIRPVTTRIAELADVYHHAQRTDDERALLSSFEPQLTVESGLVLRSAQLLADDGDTGAAIRVLMQDAVTSASKPGNGVNEQLLLAELLARAGRATEAVRLSIQWISQRQNSWFAGRLLGNVAPQVPEREGAALADAVVAKHPEIRLFLVKQLASIGAKPVAVHLLATWAAASPAPSAEELSAFVSACREQDQQGIVWQSFGEMLGRSQSSDAVIVRFSEAIADEFGIEALAPFWSRLPLAVTQQNSLLAARLTFDAHDMPATMLLLQKVDPASLNASERRMWVEMLQSAGSPDEALRVLRDRRGRLPPDILAEYARLAAQLGQESDYRAAVAAMGGHAD